MVERKIKTVKDLREILIPTNPDTVVMMPDDLSIEYLPEEDMLCIRVVPSGNLNVVLDGPLGEFMFSSVSSTRAADGNPLCYYYEDPGAAMICVFNPDKLARSYHNGPYTICVISQWCHAGDDGASLDELITVYVVVDKDQNMVASSVVGNYAYYEQVIADLTKQVYKRYVESRLHSETLSNKDMVVSQYGSGMDALRELYARSLLPVDREMDILWIDANDTGTDRKSYTTYCAPLQIVDGIDSTGNLVVITKRGNIPVLVMATEMDAVMRDRDWSVIKCFAEMIHVPAKTMPSLCKIAKREAASFIEALCEVPGLMTLVECIKEQMNEEGSCDE